MDRARRPRRADAVAGHVAVAGQHEDVVAQRLEVVGNVIAGDVALVVSCGIFLLAFCGRWQPKQLGFQDEWQAMQLILLLACAQAFSPPAGEVAPDHLPVCRTGPSWPGAPLVVVLAERGSIVSAVWAISQARFALDHRVLDDLFAAPLESACRNGVRSTERSRPSFPFGRGGIGRGPAGKSVARSPGDAVAVDALDLDGRANLAVELGVAVGVLDEVAVDAMHPFFEVDVELVHRQAVALRPARSNAACCAAAALRVRYRSFSSAGNATAAMSAAVESLADDPRRVVEQVAVPVFLEDGAEHPAMAVKIGELRVSCPWIELGEPREERGVGPVPAAQRSHPGSTSFAECEFLGGRMLLFAGDTSARRPSPRPTT